jgi:hypothetical protein
MLARAVEHVDASRGAIVPFRRTAVPASASPADRDKKK